MALNQRVGARLGAAAIRSGASPNQLTLAGVVCALLTTALVIVLFDHRLLAGLVALVGFQLAYSFDCADGQVARALGVTSQFGATLDLACDYVSHTALAVMVLALPGSAVSGGAGAALSGLFVAAFTSLVFFEALAGGMESGSPWKNHKVFMLLRQLADYGLQITVIALMVAFASSRVVFSVASAFAAYNAALVAYRVWSMGRTRGAR